MRVVWPSARSIIQSLISGAAKQKGAGSGEMSGTARSHRWRTSSARRLLDVEKDGPARLYRGH